MTWLITGGCGFVGTNLAAVLIRRGCRVVVFDNLSRLGSHRNLQWLTSQDDSRQRFSFVRGEISDPAAVDAAVASVRQELECVAHLAGQVAMTTSISNPRLDFSTNALGMVNVLEAVRRHASGSTILYSSTNKVYGDLRDVRTEEGHSRYVLPAYPAGLPESLPLEFSGPYGCSKGAADQYALDWHRTYGLNTVVFRHSSIYGSRQFSTYDQGWVGWFCAQALAQKAALTVGREPEPFTISGDGKQVRDLLFADDLAELYITAHQKVSAVCGQAFNIGGGPENCLSILELLAHLEDELSIKTQYQMIPWRAHDQKVFVADITKVQARLGWRPKVNPGVGIRKMLEWRAAMDVHLGADQSAVVRESARS